MKSGNDILKTYSQHWFDEDAEMEDENSFVKFNDALAAMEEYTSQFQSSPKYIDKLYLLQKSINAADPFGNDILIKDLKKQIDSIISKVETPGNVSPQAAENKYPIGGYAPGTYMCKCVSCSVIFYGDKRAVQCEPCAIKMTVDYNSNKPLDNFENKKNVYPIKEEDREVKVAIGKIPYKII